MEQSLTPIVVAIIGVLQVILAVYLARRQTNAAAERDEAGAAEAISSSYSILVERLEGRLAKLEENYDSLCDEYEKDKISWEAEKNRLMAKCQEYDEKLAALIDENKRLEALIAAKGL